MAAESTVEAQRFEFSSTTANLPKLDPDDALRAAIKAAVDASDLVRAKALLAVLESAPRAARVVPISLHRRGARSKG